MAGKLKLDRVVRVSCGVCEKGVSRWLRGRREGKVRILKRILEDQGVCRLQHPTGAQQETHHRERQKERGLTKRVTWQTIERMEERRRRAQTRTKEDDGLGKKRFRLRRVFFYTWLNQTRPNIGDRAGLKKGRLPRLRLRLRLGLSIPGPSSSSSSLPSPSSLISSCTTHLPMTAWLTV